MRWASVVLRLMWRDRIAGVVALVKLVIEFWFTRRSGEAVGVCIVCGCMRVWGGDAWEVMGRWLQRFCR